MGKKNDTIFFGEISIENLTLKCSILFDGTRVISEVNTPKLLVPFSENLIEPITFYYQEQEYEGYTLQSLEHICDSWIEADEKGKVNDSELVHVDYANKVLDLIEDGTVVKSIDIATNYNYRFELKKISNELMLYIDNKIYQWQTVFPIYFYEELFRLNEWAFTIDEIQDKSKVIGKYINTIVYDELPHTTIEDLQNSHPRWLVKRPNYEDDRMITRDIGNAHLSAQINQIIILFKMSDTMEKFWENFKDISKNKHSQNPYQFNDKGHTIVPFDTDKMSDFDKKIFKGLNWNPKDHKK